MKLTPMMRAGLLAADDWTDRNAPRHNDQGNPVGGVFRSNRLNAEACEVPTQTITALRTRGLIEHLLTVEGWQTGRYGTTGAGAALAESIRSAS